MIDLGVLAIDFDMEYYSFIDSGGWKAELALLADPEWTVYPQSSHLSSYWSGAEQEKFASQRPVFYHHATSATWRSNCRCADL